MPHPECPICFEKYDVSTVVPMVLECGHTMCSQCIAQLSTSTASLLPTRICCTSCRKQCNKQATVTNYALLDVLGSFASLDQTITVTDKMCSICYEALSYKHIMYCNTCEGDRAKEGRKLTTICAHCGIKEHRGHDLQPYVPYSKMLRILAATREVDDTFVRIVSDINKKTNEMVRHIRRVNEVLVGNVAAMEAHDSIHKMVEGLNAVYDIKDTFVDVMKNLHRQMDKVIRKCGNAINNEDIVGGVSDSENEENSA